MGFDILLTFADQVAFPIGSTHWPTVISQMFTRFFLHKNEHFALVQ
jgi:hypothetical protein